MKLQQVDSIVDDMMCMVDDGVKGLMADPPTDTDHYDYFEYAWGKNEFMRWIRNHYHLWDTHPLTARWREEGPNDLRGGVDHSIDHPDNVSSQIFDRFVERLKKSRNK